VDLFSPRMEKAALELHVEDQNKKPQEGVAFKIDMLDGGSMSGKLKLRTANLNQLYFEDARPRTQRLPLSPNDG